MVAHIRCERCRKQIRSEQLSALNRCLDWNCPTFTYRARMAHAKRLGRLADHLAALDSEQVDLMVVED
jgi:hypothetical protein